MGVVTPQAMPTYPYGFPDDVIDPFMNRTGRGVLGNKPASGTEIIQELGEEHQRTGKWIVYTSADSVFQIAAHEETVPLEELYDACRVAREILTGKHAVGRVIARPFTGEPGSYERTPNRHDFSLEPRRPNYLSLVRDAGPQGLRRREDRRHLRPPGHRRGVPDEVERRGHPEDRGAAAHDRRRLRLHEPRRDRLALGPPQRPGQLPPLPAGLRPAAAGPARRAAAERPADPHLRPRLRPDDAVDRPLARARVAARVRRGAKRGGQHPRGGRVRRRRRDRQRVARRQARRRAACRARRSSSREPAQRPGARARAVRRRGESAARARRSTPTRKGPTRGSSLLQAIAEVAPRACSRSAAARASSPSGSCARARRGARARRPVAADGRARARRAASTRTSATCRRCRSPDGAFDSVVAAWMLYHVGDVDRRARRARARTATGRPPRRGHELRRPPGGASRAGRGARMRGRGCRSSRENGAELLRRHFASVERTATSTDG